MEEFFSTPSGVGEQTYEVIKKDWVASSGRVDGKGVYYIKIMESGDSFFNFIIAYPFSEEKKYKPIVERIEKCFRPGHDYAALSPEDEGWRIYVNDRYQYQICYPYHVLKPQGEPDAGDGQKFLAADGGEMVVFGGYNAMEWSLPYEVEQQIPYVMGKNGKITYKVIKKDWAVYSGVGDSSKEFYGKVMLHDGRFLEFSINYPVHEKEKYRQIVKKLEKCFIDDEAR